MRIEDLAVNLRARTPWEASDLGVVMLKCWWKPVIGVWLAVYLPVAIALTAAFGERAWIAMVGLWWLKPVFDRFVLHVLSRAVFGDLPSVGATLRAWREILRGGVFADLTFKRFSFRRSFYLPIAQLEGARGKLRVERTRLLRQRVGFHAAAITIACLSFEVIATLGVQAMVDFMKPDDPDVPDFDFSAWWMGLAGQSLIEPLDLLYYVFAVSVIEPLYVAQGFALYLARRTHLEGWDIELGLRRIANRLGGAAGALALASLLVLATIPASQPLAAESTVSAARTTINEILDAPAFEVNQEITEWRWKGAREKEASAPRTQWNLPFLDFLAGLTRGLAWLAALGVVIAAIWYGRRFVQPAGSAAPSAGTVRGMAFGLDVRPDRLPRDLPAAVRDLIMQDQFREALSLMYRGALSVLIYRYRMPVNPGDTERKCVGAAGTFLPPEGARLFAELVRAWEHSAYANRPPAAHECKRLLQGWTTHFATTQHQGDTAPPTTMAAA